MSASEACYETLGLSRNASRVEVKEAFRKLCLQYHPDKCPTDARPLAESRFRAIKNAYDNILRGQAGYGPPPPGTGPNPSYAKAYSRAHGMTGPIRCGGPYGGYLTEMEFYRAMLRSSRNSPFVLLLSGLVCIPAAALLTSAISGNGTFIKRFKEEGITLFTDERLKVNGRSSTINPFMIRDLRDEKHELYTYKYDKFRHLRPKDHVDDASIPSDTATMAAAGAAP